MRIHNSTHQKQSQQRRICLSGKGTYRAKKSIAIARDTFEQGKERNFPSNWRAGGGGGGAGGGREWVRQRGDGGTLLYREENPRGGSG